MVKREDANEEQGRTVQTYPSCGMGSSIAVSVSSAEKQGLLGWSQHHTNRTMPLPVLERGQVSLYSVAL